MFRHKPSDPPISSQLYDQDTFYRAFLHDVRNCRRQLIIESPFITSKRAKLFLPIFKQLRERGVQIIVNTRDPQEHEGLISSPGRTGGYMVSGTRCSSALYGWTPPQTSNY